MKISWKKDDRRQEVAEVEFEGLQDAVIKADVTCDAPGGAMVHFNSGHTVPEGFITMVLANGLQHYSHTTSPASKACGAPLSWAIFTESSPSMASTSKEKIENLLKKLEKIEAGMQKNLDKSWGKAVAEKSAPGITQAGV